ncbi:venom acid phosphatase Acph-1-like isoform X2 [Atheta coriaria]|uniref:venom acid phosphatase Acph-1-like isoform X2 n=1 Tax=Dalotia coriaria TaxID=877792 RepID=UPI0031F3600D
MKNPKKILQRLYYQLLRHGERIPDKMTDYPANPYKNYSYFPYELGDLTRKGQKTMIELGLLLKKRYKAFLGDRYFGGLISSTSSSYIRCQMSLQALHAGLFWTNNWNAVEGLPWQPIPYQTLPINNDYVSIFKTCPSVLTNITIPELDMETQEVFDYLKQHSGYDEIDYMRALTIFDHTKTNLEVGLDPPDWLKKIYPEPLKSVGMKFWKLVIDQKQRIGAGPLLQRIVQHAELSNQGVSITKMFLYAGHDITIHFLLNALNSWKSEIVEYGALLLFELHKIHDTVGFKVFFRNNAGGLEDGAIYIPNCGLFCPLKQFIKLVEHTYNPTLSKNITLAVY